jgi:ABC-type phosphate/phosphonate transport system ATPase subunit
MPKRSRKDINVLASQIVEQATHKNPAAVALGRLGGLKGGKARAKKLSPQQRTEIARKAAQARWQK